jgi:saccharopine dehydrogenase (NAD+, L-lysine-forming)
MARKPREIDREGRAFVVLGGAGAMGRITVRDLVEFARADDRIVIADFDEAKARALAESLDDRRVSAVRVDVRDREGAKRALAGAFAVINSVQYQLNIEVMELALALGAHYLDLGGLFHMTRKQLALDARFREAGLLALLGMGAAPGITNLLSRLGADRLDRVQEIHTRVAGVDRTEYKPRPALAVSYSLQTILEEFSLEPAVFSRGEMKFVQPMTGDLPHRFPPPVGVRRPMYTLHSEVATLVDSFASKGVREVSFKIAFDPEFLDRVRFLRDLGLASHETIRVGDASVRPIELVNRVAMSQPSPRRVGRLNQHEIVRAIVKGTARGRKQTWILDCHTTGNPAWEIGTDINTGSPPAVAALLLADGEITARGVAAPENAVPAERFFEQLARRKLWVTETRRAGWSVPT